MYFTLLFTQYYGIYTVSTAITLKYYWIHNYVNILILHDSSISKALHFFVKTDTYYVHYWFLKSDDNTFYSICLYLKEHVYIWPLL